LREEFYNCILWWCLFLSYTREITKWTHFSY